MQSCSATQSSICLVAVAVNAKIFTWLGIILRRFPISEKAIRKTSISPVIAVYMLDKIIILEPTVHIIVGGALQYYELLLELTIV